MPSACRRMRKGRGEARESISTTASCRASSTPSASSTAARSAKCSSSQLEASPGRAAGSRDKTWRVDGPMAGLGTTMSIGVHVYDILRYLLSSEIETVSAFFDTPRGVMEETNLSMFRFANGVDRAGERPREGAVSAQRFRDLRHARGASRAGASRAAARAASCTSLGADGKTKAHAVSGDQRPRGVR